MSSRQATMPSGRFARAILGSLTLVLCAALCPVRLIPAQEDDRSRATTPGSLEPPSDHRISWFESLDTAKNQARLRRAPILIKAGAEWCGYCRLLDEEIGSPQVQAELQRWLPVALDVDREPRVARDLGIGPIPALRVLSPDGRLIASQDGFLDADALVQWLEEQHEIADLTRGAELSDVGSPDAIAVIRVLREFDRRDATLREAAVARLAPYPEAAAAPVAAKIGSGTLAEQLTALELLLLWNAPVDELDPWQPDTLTEERLASLEGWLKEKDFSPGRHGSLTPAEIVDAERLLRLMTNADAAAAAAMREQLARMGDEVLPLIRDALEHAPDDASRARLTAARYRLAASGQLALTWPGGIERLSSQDFQQRIGALDELSRVAASADEGLLLALFSDPAPLIRELALRTLKRISGQAADGALVRLLDDPDANVRAAVLKELAESPSSPLVPKIAAYVKREQDPDLIVHAVRFLREVQERTAVAALLGLFRHSSWRVRAEAADAVTNLLKNEQLKSQVDQPAIQAALIELLDDEDGFVVSRAASGLELISTNRAVEPLVRAARTHPELAPEIIRTLFSSSTYRTRALPFLQEACAHELASVRAAAITGLISHKEGDAFAQIEQGIRDEAVAVRTAVMDAVFVKLCEEVDLIRDADVEQPTTAASSVGGLLGWLFRSRSPASAAPESPAGDEAEADGGDAVLLDETYRAERALQSIRTKRRLSDWLYQTEPLLAPQLQAEQLSERAAAARVLSVIGHAEALAVLLQAANDPASRERVSECLPRLLWDERKTLFAKLTESPQSVASLAHVAEQLAAAADPRAAALLWELPGRQEADRRLVSGVLDPLLTSYFGENTDNIEESPRESIERCTADCARYAAEGAPWQRLAALLVLLHVDRQGAIPPSEAALADATLPLEIRVDALHVLLFCEDDDAAAGRSISLLAADENALAQAALSYLALGDEAVTSEIETFDPSVRWLSDREFFSGEKQSGPIVPELPGEITAQQLDRFLGSRDVRVAAHAGYLRVLLGDAASLAPVIAGWEAAPQSAEYRRLAYRAIARVNDPATVSILEQIYAQLQSEPYPESDVRAFYWTIRTMTGPQVLKLRKQIRNDYGAAALQ